jgi:hypothetical protein
LKKNRITQPEQTRQHADSAASAARHVIDGGLDDPIRGADQIGFLGANGNRHTLLPLRFDGIAEDGAWVAVRWEVVGPRQTGAERAGNETTDSPQELPAFTFVRLKRVHAISFR